MVESEVNRMTDTSQTNISPKFSTNAYQVFRTLAAAAALALGQPLPRNNNARVVVLRNYMAANGVVLTTMPEPFSTEDVTAPEGGKR
jgi:hypothetical protein